MLSLSNMHIDKNVKKLPSLHLFSLPQLSIALQIMRKMIYPFKLHMNSLPAMHLNACNSVISGGVSLKKLVFIACCCLSSTQPLELDVGDIQVVL